MKVNKDMENIIKVNFRREDKPPHLKKILYFLSQPPEVQIGMLYLSIQEIEMRLNKLDNIHR